MFVKDYIKIWQIIYWSIIWVLFFSHIDKDAPSFPRIEQSPLYEFTSCEPPVFPQNSSSNLSPFLCFYLCLYLIFYFFTHHTQSKSGRPGALQDKEVSTMSLLCVYAYVYFYIMLYHVHFYTYIISIFFFLYLLRASNLETIYTECFRIIFENFVCGLIWLISRGDYNKKKYIIIILLY